MVDQGSPAVLRDSSPPFVVIYGESGVGKTTEAIAAFPNGLFLAQPGALKPAWHVLGIPLHPVSNGETRGRYIHVRYLESVQKVLDHLARVDVEVRPSAVVLDDISLLAANTLRRMKPRYPEKGRGVFRLWADFRAIVETCADHARHLGIALVANAHVRPPSTDDKGVYYKGGPMFPSKTLTKDIPHVADTVLRAALDAGRTPWPAVYVAEPSAEWFQKERHGFAGLLPANLGELLRAAGYNLPRPKGMEWQESVAEAVAEAVLNGKAASDVCTRAVEKLRASGYDPRHVYWAVRDGRDRAELVHMRYRALATF